MKFLYVSKGKFHPYDFINNEFIILQDNQEDDWDLKCYKHETGYFLIFYLNINRNSLFYKTRNYNIQSDPVMSSLHYFKLPENQDLGHNYQYKFPSIYKRGEYLKFLGMTLILNYAGNENYVNYNILNGETSLMEAKSISGGYIDDNYYFYSLTYNNISDFSSGYSNTFVDLTQRDYANSVPFTINNNTPFSFLDNMEIKEIKFTENQGYAYYKIYNTNNYKTNINFKIFL